MCLLWLNKQLSNGKEIEMTPITIVEYNRLKNMFHRLTKKKIQGTASKAELMYTYELRMKLLRYEESKPYDS